MESKVQILTQNKGPFRSKTMLNYSDEFIKLNYLD